MTPKPKQMSEETLDALSGVVCCPICGEMGLNLTEVTLTRTDNPPTTFRKTRAIAGSCDNCYLEGRGEVKVFINQRF